MAKIKSKQKTNKNVKMMMIVGALFVLGLMMMVPFFYMVSVSFEQYANRVLPFPPRLLPEFPSTFNYMLAFEGGGIMRAYFNSGITSLASVALGIGSSLLAGYAFSKGNFKGKKLLLLIVLSTMMIPFQTRLIPMHRMFYTIGLTNTFWALILPRVLDGFGILLAKQYFDNLPNSLREAAQIDGGTEGGIFFRVFLPLTGPITATLVILTFMNSWNDFLWPLIALTNDKLHTIPVFMATKFALQDGASYLAGSTMATATLSILPIVIVFLFFQRYIIESIALSGIKGE